MTHDLSSNDLVDTHLHVFDRGCGWPGARYVPAYDAPLASWRRLALAQGVRRGVLVQTSFMGTDNARLLSELRQHPDALRGVAVVDPGSDLTLLAPLHAAGVRGLRLNLAGTTHDLAAWRSASATWEAVLALGLHIELHTDLGALPPVLAQLPAEVAVVIDHMGKPEGVSVQDPTVRALAARSRHGAVHVKLSGAYRLARRDPAALARLWVEEVGPQALLWGSDWPCTNHEAHADYPRLLADLHDWLPAPAARQALVDNPQALYWGVPFRR